MYKIGITLFLVGSLLSCNNPYLSQDEKSFGYKSDSIVLINLIEKESKAFWDKDFEKYSECYAHEDYIRTIGWWQGGGIVVVEGWNERSIRAQQLMNLSSEPNKNAIQVNRKNVNLRIFDDVAWLTFDQHGVDTNDPLMDMPGLSRETRIFEKHNGEWKLVYVGWLLEGE
ncbi:MAG: nuclear transport factor 2 family protein [Fulvivirga sp.]